MYVLAHQPVCFKGTPSERTLERFAPFASENYDHALEPIVLDTMHEVATADDFDASDVFGGRGSLTLQLQAALLPRQILFVHSSCVMVKGEDMHAYAFFGASGTGKSTHARMWEKAFGDEVEILNDDMPLLSFHDEGVEVHGSPWQGKHKRGTSGNAPLKGIACLTQADENRVVSLSTRAALARVMSQLYMHHGLEAEIMALIEQLLKQVPIVELYCTPGEEAARVCRAGLENLGNHA